MMNKKNVETKALKIQSREAVKDISGVKVSFMDTVKKVSEAVCKETQPIFHVEMLMKVPYNIIQFIT